MAMDLNCWHATGRLTKDATLEYSKSGTALCKFVMAVNGMKTKDGVDQVSFLECQWWGKGGEALSKYLKKGKAVTVEANLIQNRWEKDGQKYSKIIVNIKQLQLGSGASKENEMPATNANPASEEIPEGIW